MADGHSSIEAFVDVALDWTPGPTVLVDPDGRITAVNTAWRLSAADAGADLVNVGPGANYLEVCRRSAADGCDDAAAVLTGLTDVLAGRTDAFVHTYSLTGEEAARWGQVTVHPLPPPAGGAFLTHRDVTAEVDAQEAFGATGAWSAAVVRESPDLYSLTDPDGTVRWISPSVERILGWQVEDLIGRRSFELVHPDDLPGLAARAAEDREHEGPAAPAVFRMRTKDGEYRWVEVVQTNLMDNPAVRGMIVVARDVTERMAFERELTRLATTDPLTSLANRAALLSALHQRLGDRPSPVRVAYVDLDGFRLVNDSLGHGAGDALLVEVGRRLTACAQDDEQVCRIGGDEFVVILTPAGSLEACMERLLAAFAEPFAVGGNVAVFSASIGVAESGATGDLTPEDLIDRADTAMYVAKRSTGSRWRVFVDEMHETAIRQIAVAAELRHAIADGEIEPLFQPVYSLSDGSLVGVEALARWCRSDGEVWTPDMFLEVCERSGQCRALDRLMLEESCARVAGWAMPGGPWLAVNASAEHMDDPSLPDIVTAVLARHGLPPQRLHVEVIEWQAFGHGAEADAVRRLAASGVQVSLDDFGTGWSSLARLADLPVNTLKIDRQFVSSMCRDRTSLAIAEAVIALGRVLGLMTIAEGVDDPEQVALLRELGADAVQGYLVGRPMHLDDIRPVAMELRLT